MFHGIYVNKYVYGGLENSEEYTLLPDVDVVPFLFYLFKKKGFLLHRGSSIEPLLFKYENSRNNFALMYVLLSYIIKIFD